MTKLMTAGLIMEKSGPKESGSRDGAENLEQKRKEDHLLPELNHGGKYPDMRFSMIGSQMMYYLNLLGIEASLKKNGR